MILRSSPPSPFGRKIKIGAAVLGLSDRISVVKADTSDPSDPLRDQNPLGKIPILILDDGQTLFDSRVILEYFDMLAGGGKIIPAGMERFETLRLQALADGIMDAAILQMYEIRWREEPKREPRWVEHQAGKVERGLRHLDANADSLRDRIDVGTISIACALGYLDLRFEGAWRAGQPALAAWLENFEKAVPAFGETRFQG